MFTLFAIPKPFRGSTAVLQKNAIRSWTLLRPAPDIVLFGNDEGVADAAAELGVRSIPEIRRNDLGTPYVSEAFRAAQEGSPHNLFVYCNSDIILLQDFADAVQRIGLERFVAAGRRWNLDVTQDLSFGPGWEAELRTRVRKEGHLFRAEGMDYFVFTRGALLGMPAFVVGRPSWDNWIIFHTRKEGIPLIDMTEAVLVVHQNHDYSHIPQREGNLYEGPEARQNRVLWDSMRYNFHIEDATHRLLPSGVRREWRYSRWKRNLDVWPILHPRLAPWITIPRRFISRLVLQPLRKIAQSRS